LKLIRELNEHVEHLVETIEESGKTRHYLSGIYMEAGVKNRNGREYPVETLAKEATRFNNEIVKENRGFGELGHPSGPQINLDRVAILIKEIKQNNSQFMGKEGEAKLGVSSRALGSLKEDNGVMIVQPDLKLITVDVVADPSAPNAFVEGIMENADWVEDETGGWKMVEAAARVKKRVKKMSVNQINENKVRLFENFLAEIVGKKS
jgi:hypothetical protein